MVPRTPASIVAVLTMIGALAGCSPSSGSSSAATTAANGGAANGSTVPTVPAVTVPWPVTDCGTYSGTGCAPVEQLVDVDRPTFSHPTEITNPLFPISTLTSAVFLGRVDDKPFRSETTLLPGTATVVWDGQPIEVVLSQYLAYSDGQITEVALDRYAQADDGSVWYFGEDVYDYDAETGTVAVTEGTWLAGRDGNPAMIMPAQPEVGDVWRTETVLGVVFEEVTAKSVDQTQPGPAGDVSGILVGSELHLDGSRSDKLFAPGYGEFYTENDTEVEAMAVAAGVDRLTTPEPSALRTLLTAAGALGESARVEDWEAVDSARSQIDKAVTMLAEVTPPRVVEAITAAVASLDTAAKGQDIAASVLASLEVVQSGLDVAVRFRAEPAIDIARFHLHADRLRAAVDAADGGGVAAETATLEWLPARFAARVPGDVAATMRAGLTQLRTASNSANLAAAGDVAARLAAELDDVVASTTWSN
jgi:hypothetical protein